MTTDINGWILFGSIAFGVVTFFLGFYLGANVRRTLDNTADGADGDMEPYETGPAIDANALDPLTVGDIVDAANSETAAELRRRDVSVRASDDKTPENGGQE